jgi:TonB family protein
MLSLLLTAALLAPPPISPRAGGSGDARPPVAAVYRVGGQVSRPELLQIQNGIPPFTEMSLKARLQGEVRVEGIVDEQGIPQQVRLVRGLPMGLDQVALALVERLRFAPASLEGKPVAVRHFFRVVFKVREPSERFAKLLAGHPKFAQALRERRFADAEALLGSSSEPAAAPALVELALCYLRLAQGRFGEAWERARAEERQTPPEIREEKARAILDALHTAVFQAMDRQRPALVELGLEVSDPLSRSVSAPPPAPSLRADLLREKVRLEVDPGQQADGSQGSPGPLDELLLVVEGELDYGSVFAVRSDGP